MLASIGLSRDTNCFIANVVKCRPPQNRDPAADEQAACLGYLRRQIALLRPQAILCVGRIASGALLRGSEGVGKLRGSWRDFEGLPLMVTYHPSALLRDDTYKRPAREDLKKFRERLSFPS
jgi:DNA polymerase